MLIQIHPEVVPVAQSVLGSSGVINALDLDQAGLGVRVPAATLVAQVATPKTRGQFIGSIGGRFFGQHRGRRVGRALLVLVAAPTRMLALSMEIVLT